MHGDRIWNIINIQIESLQNPSFEDSCNDREMIIATAGYDRTIRFWETLSGVCNKMTYVPALPVAELCKNGNRPQHVNKLERSPDKRYLAAACNPYIRLFDLHSPHETVYTYRSHKGNVTSLDFQCDGRVMYSGSEDGTVMVWDLRAQAKLCQKAYENMSAVNTVALHPNQIELISGDQNGSIRVWDLRADLCRCELVPEADTPVRSLSIKPSGTMIVAANNSGICYVWGLLHGRQMMSEFEPLHKLQAHNGYILKCALSPENKYLATASSDKTVKIWNVEDFKLEKVLTGHQKWVWDCNFTETGEHLVTASSDMTARLWSIPSGQELRVFRGHHRGVLCCALLD